MNGLPYYKAYPRDFIEGTIGLDFETKAAYRLALDLIYMHGGKLPDNARYISGLLGCSVKKWNSLRERLITAKKLYVSGDHLQNYRADKELETLGKIQDKQRENRSHPNKNKTLNSPWFNHTDTDTDTDKRDVVVSAQARDDADLTYREKLLHAAGIDPRKTITPGPKAPGSEMDMIEARKWLNDSRFGGEDEIVQMVSSIRSGMRDPPSTLRYFTKPLLAFAAAKSASLPAPHEVTHDRPTAHDRRSTAASERLGRILDAAARTD